MFDLKEYFKERCNYIDGILADELPAEDLRPALLHEAMRYAVLNGGKRIRPVLCMAAAESVGADPSSAVKPAAAIEILHAYTLVHDDLPSMDDDDLRRGKPTVHKVFGEANAILTGDALQALAFKIAASSGLPAITEELAEAAVNVVAGQVEDINHEEKPTETAIDFVHRNKTAALFRASLRMGGIAGGADNDQLQALTTFGVNTGLAFQITDDLLDDDEEGEPELSCLMIKDREAAISEAKALVEDAIDSLSKLQADKIGPLRAIAELILTRKA